MAGSEMTTLGGQHSNRVAGLVYLDAGDDPRDYPAEPAYRALFDKLPPSVTSPARASVDERKSFQAYRDWQIRTIRFAFPESELRQRFDVNPDGSVGPPRAVGPISQKVPVSQLIGEGSKKRDYSGIQVPILYLPAAPPKADGWSQYYRFAPTNAVERTTLQKIYAADRTNLNRYEKNMQAAVGKVRIVELRGADHYVYFTNEMAVLRELRKFLRGLRRHSSRRFPCVRVDCPRHMGEIRRPNQFSVWEIPKRNNNQAPSLFIFRRNFPAGAETRSRRIFRLELFRRGLANGPRPFRLGARCRLANRGGTSRGRCRCRLRFPREHGRWRRSLSARPSL